MLTLKKRKESDVMEEKLFELKLKGYCCSQIITEMSLEYMGMDCPELVASSEGLCDGARVGGTCGVVTAGLAVMYLADREEAKKGLDLEFTEWFEEAFGSISCTDLLGDDPAAKTVKCPMMVEAALTWLADMLEWE
ncbi:MAG: C-GCAxxG-C-C family protein [Firmicutes bacterium]|nr:C-GCAxxG-C-C family protein [Bacillota bacterium]